MSMNRAGTNICWTPKRQDWIWRAMAYTVPTN